MRTRFIERSRFLAWGAGCVAVGLAAGFAFGSWDLAGAVAEDGSAPPVAVIDSSAGEVPDGLQEALDSYAEAVRTKDYTAAAKLYCGNPDLQEDITTWPVVGGRSLVDVRRTDFAEVTMTAGTLDEIPDSDRVKVRVYAEFVVDSAEDGRSFIREVETEFVPYGDKWQLC